MTKSTVLFLCLLLTLSPGFQSLAVNAGGGYHNSWKLQVNKGNDAKHEGEMRFQCEFFLDHMLILQGEMDLNEINGILQNWSGETGSFEVLRLVILNQDREPWVIRVAGISYLWTGQEVMLRFFPGHNMTYILETRYRPVEKQAWQVLYVDKSGGLENMMYADNALQDMLSGTAPFLAFFHGQGNSLIHISQDSPEDEIRSFRNRMAGESTQPPHKLSEELNELLYQINTWLGGQREYITLKMDFFLGRNNFNVIDKQLLYPLLSNRIEDLHVTSWHARVHTEFEARYKRPGIKYININND